MEGRSGTKVVEKNSSRWERTNLKWVQSLGFFDIAVDFDHLVYGRVRPPFSMNDFLNLFAKRLCMFRLFGQVIQSVGDSLSSQVR